MQRPASARPGMVSGAYSAPSAITSASAHRGCPSISTSRWAGSIRVTLPWRNSMPRRSSRSSGRENSSGFRSPTISHNSDGGKKCCPARSTAITRSEAGSSLRNVSAATMPPIPAPSTNAVRLISIPLENDDFVGPLRPRGELIHGAARDTFDQLPGCDSACIKATAARADFAAVAHHHAQHVADVVIALRYLLPIFCARGSVTDKEHLDLRFARLEQRSCKPQSVVAALRTIWSVVQNHQVFHNCLRLVIII